MEYKITHEATIEANSAEEAKLAYAERWQIGYYEKDDLDINPEE